jgi:hypothetical protein
MNRRTFLAMLNAAGRRVEHDARFESLVMGGVPAAEARDRAQAEFMGVAEEMARQESARKKPAKAAVRPGSPGGSGKIDFIGDMEWVYLNADLGEGEVDWGSAPSGGARWMLKRLHKNPKAAEAFMDDMRKLYATAERLSEAAQKKQDSRVLLDVIDAALLRANTEAGVVDAVHADAGGGVLGDRGEAAAGVAGGDGGRPAAVGGVQAAGVPGAGGVLVGAAGGAGVPGPAGAADRPVRDGTRSAAVPDGAAGQVPGVGPGQLVA